MNFSSAGSSFCFIYIVATSLLLPPFSISRLHSHCCFPASHSRAVLLPFLYALLDDFPQTTSFDLFSLRLFFISFCSAAPCPYLSLPVFFLGLSFFSHSPPPPPSFFPAPRHSPLPLLGLNPAPIDNLHSSYAHLYPVLLYTSLSSRNPARRPDKPVMTVSTFSKML